MDKDAIKRLFRLQNHLVSGLVFFAVLLPSASPAQMFSYERDDQRLAQSFGPAYYQLDFSRGTDAGSVPLFTNPALGLHFTRQNFAASLAYGRQSGSAVADGRQSGSSVAEDSDLRLLDAALFVWSELGLARGAGTRLFLPFILHSGYRSVEERAAGIRQTETFNLAVLGLGSGLGFDMNAVGRVSLHVRATPIFGLATRSFEGQAGTTRLLDVDAQANLLRLVNRYGLTVGYNFRIQRWNVEESTLRAPASDTTYRYDSTQHVVRVAVNW